MCSHKTADATFILLVSIILHFWLKNGAVNSDVVLYASLIPTETEALSEIRYIHGETLSQNKTGTVLAFKNVLGTKLMAH